MPVEEIALIGVRPFDRIVVHTAELISDKQFLSRYHGDGIPQGRFLHAVWPEAHAGHRSWLLAIEPRLTIKRTPESDATTRASDSKDSAAAFWRAERDRRYVRSTDRCCKGVRNVGRASTFSPQVDVRSETNC